MKTKKRTLRTRIGVLCLCLCLFAGFMPSTASAAGTGYTVFGYKTGEIVSLNTEKQSDCIQIADYDNSLLGLEMIGDTIYGLSTNHSFSASTLVILNPDFTVRKTVGSWRNDDFVIVDTAVQNDKLWGTYNEAEYEFGGVGEDGESIMNFKSGTSYLIPFDLTTGLPDNTRIYKITGLPEREIIYTIACNAAGQMYAIVADGGDNGGAATLYTVDTNSFEATRVGSTGVTTNYISSSAFAPDGTLYWAENNAGKLYTVNTQTGSATVVPGGSIGGSSNQLNAMMITDDSDVAYVRFAVKGEDGTIAMDNETVSGLQKVTAGKDLELTFTPGEGNKVKEVIVDGEKKGAIKSYTFSDVGPWGRGIHTVEVTFQSKEISIAASPWTAPYFGKDSLQYHPTFEAGLYFTVKNGPNRKTADGESNYRILIEKDGVPVEKAGILPGTYDIHVIREADEDWYALDVVLEDDLIIVKQTMLYQWTDLEMTARPGDTLADIEKPAYLVSPLDGKKIPGTFCWNDDESTSVGDPGDRTGFTFRFIPDMPLSEELDALYDFSNMPDGGFGEGTQYPFTVYVTVADGETPGDIVPITLPVRVLEKGDKEYILREELSATFTPDTAVSIGDFSEGQGLSIDYRFPMEEPENFGTVSPGYDIQAKYIVTVPFEDYNESSLSGILTVPLPEGYDGASARIKGGVTASSYTKNSVTFPVTFKEDEIMGLSLSVLIEYKKAQEPVSPPVSIPSTQKPAVETDEHCTVTLSPYGTIATITVEEGYELADVVLNGTSLGKVNQVTGLKTGDKLTVTTKEKIDEEAAKNERLKEGVKNTTIRLRSTLGDGFIRLDWEKSAGYKVDYYEVYKSTKRYSGYGTEPYFETKQGGLTGWYKNTKELKKGVRYYYKVRGVREIAGETVYTNWSTKAWRLVK